MTSPFRTWNKNKRNLLLEVFFFRNQNNSLLSPDSGLRTVDRRHIDPDQ